MNEFNVLRRKHGSRLKMSKKELTLMKQIWQVFSSLFRVLQNVYSSLVYLRKMWVVGDDNKRFNIATSPLRLLPVFKVTVYRITKLLCH